MREPAPDPRPGERTGQRAAAARLALEWSHLARARGSMAQADDLRKTAVEIYTAGGAAHLIDAIDASAKRG